MNRSGRSSGVVFLPASSAARTGVLEADRLHHIIKGAFP